MFKWKNFWIVQVIYLLYTINLPINFINNFCILEQLAIVNITFIFFLINNTFIIVIFGIQLCIAKVIAMYEQKDKFYSYVTRLITDIQDLLYVSLQVFTYIQGHIFTEFDENGYSLFSHYEPKHIVYNIGRNNVQIEKNILFLKGTARTIFTKLNNIKFYNTLAKF